MLLNIRKKENESFTLYNLQQHILAKGCELGRKFSWNGRAEATCTLLNKDQQFALTTRCEMTG